jgi:hypothetical protein
VEWPPHLKKKRLLCLILLGEHLCKFAFSFLIELHTRPWRFAAQSKTRLIHGFYVGYRCGSHPIHWHGHVVDFWAQKVR